MKKTLQGVLLATIWTLSGNPAKAITPAEQIQDAISSDSTEILGIWSCRDRFADTSNPAGISIVEATIYNAEIKPGKRAGKIAVNGSSENALYQQIGQAHKWLFDFAEIPAAGAARNRAAFRITPDGIGIYYYFGEKKHAEPSLFLKCQRIR